MPLARKSVMPGHVREIQRKGDAAKPATGSLLPHERDQSTRGQESAPRRVIKQAREDVVTGRKDTDLHGTPGLDQVQK
jgi:hypothetical protein